MSDDDSQVIGVVLTVVLQGPVTPPPPCTNLDAQGMSTVAVRHKIVSRSGGYGSEDQKPAPEKIRANHEFTTCTDAT